MTIERIDPDDETWQAHRLTLARCNRCKDLHVRLHEDDGSVQAEIVMDDDQIRDHIRELAIVIGDIKLEGLADIPCEGTA